MQRYNNYVITKRHCTIKPGEARDLLGHIKKTLDFIEGETILIEDVRMANDERSISNVRAIPGLYDIEKHGNLQFQICNITTEDISIKPG